MVPNENVPAVVGVVTWKQKFDKWAIKARSILNLTSLGLGFIATNVADVITGGYTMGVAFGNFWFGFILSFAFQFIQLVLWNYILNNKTKIFIKRKNKLNVKWSILVALLLAGFLAFLDTNVDTAAVPLWIAESGFIQRTVGIMMFGYPMTRVVIVSVEVGTYILTMFGELFNSWYFNMADRDSKVAAGAIVTKQTKARNKPLSPGSENLANLLGGDVPTRNIPINTRGKTSTIQVPRRK